MKTFISIILVLALGAGVYFFIEYQNKQNRIIITPENGGPEAFIEEEEEKTFSEFISRIGAGPSYQCDVSGSLVTGKSFEGQVSIAGTELVSGSFSIAQEDESTVDALVLSMSGDSYFWNDESLSSVGLTQKQTFAETQYSLGVTSYDCDEGVAFDSDVFTLPENVEFN